MATVIDALVVTLGLDAKGWKTGSADAISSLKKTKDETTRVSKEMEERGAQAAQFFAKIRNEALALLAVFTAGVGIKNFTENTVGSAVSLKNLSENLKMSTQEIDAWGKAAERAGGTQEGIRAQLKESANEASLRKMGQTSDTQQWFFRMGGDPKALKDGNAFLLERSRIIANIYKRDPALAMNVARSMGISEESFNLLKKGPAYLLTMVDAQKKNVALNNAQVESLFRLNNRWLDFRDRLTVTGQTILSHLEPILERLLARLTAMADWVAAHREDIKQWIDKAAQSIEDFVKWADKAAESVGGWKNVIMALIGLKVSASLLHFSATLAGIAGSLGTIAGASGIGAAKILGRIGGVGALAYDFINPKEAGAGEDDELKKLQGKSGIPHGAYPGGSAERGRQIVANALGDLLFKGEGSYDSVNRGALGGYKAGKEDLQNMTIKDVMRHQAKGDFNAAGKYQIIKGTLSEAVQAMGISENEKFNEATQDRIFREFLVGMKRPHLRDYLSGKSGDLQAALKDASKEWASIADPDTGRSYYAGVGNNRASITADQAAKALINDRGAIASRNYLQQQGDTGAQPAGNTSSVETNFNGPITINTKATDAAGVARGFQSEINTIMAAQANSGQN